MPSSFSGFYIAKSGITTAQANLNITGQNMANVNTSGYTRQRLDTYAVGSNTTNMRYADPNGGGTGGGVANRGASQIRDPYLDVRYRMENAKVGDTAARLESLTDLENIFDETVNKGLDSQFRDLISQLQTFARNSTDPVTENIVKTSSLLLVQAFNNTSKQIEQIRNQQINSLETENMNRVNSLLSSIAHINTQIKSADISGNPALELLDQRNQMIDELSNYVNIEVTSNNVSVGAGNTVYELSINMVSGNQKFNLVDDASYRQFALKKENNNVTFPVTLQLNNADGSAVTKSMDESVTLNNGEINDYLTSGYFSGALKQLNGKGDFATGTESTERGTDYYQKMLDRLANSFAVMMNDANSTVTGANNKPLFTTTDGTTATGITAANISLSSAWTGANGCYLTGSKNNGEAGSNILHMVNQFTTKRTYTTSDDASGKAFFNGTFQECVSNIGITLGLQIQDIGRQNKTYQSTLDEVDDKRASISSVDVNEEGINLIMYNQALTASSRFMTTLDEAMDTIINKMGVTGR